MISPITSHLTPPNLGPIYQPNGLAKTSQLPPSAPTHPLRETPTAASFDNMLGRMIGQVDASVREAGQLSQDIFLGRSDQLHRGVLALQEASLSLSLMVEVRNKLVESYQEIMRMPV